MKKRPLNTHTHTHQIHQNGQPMKLVFERRFSSVILLFEQYCFYFDIFMCITFLIKIIQSKRLQRCGANVHHKSTQYKLNAIKMNENNSTEHRQNRAIYTFHAHIIYQLSVIGGHHKKDTRYLVSWLIDLFDAVFALQQKKKIDIMVGKL